MIIFLFDLMSQMSDKVEELTFNDVKYIFQWIRWIYTSLSNYQYQYHQQKQLRSLQINFCSHLFYMKNNSIQYVINELWHHAADFLYSYSMY